MKHERIAYKLLSAMLAFVMLVAIGAEGAGYVYAEQVQSTEEPQAVQLQDSEEESSASEEPETQEDPAEPVAQGDPADLSEEQEKPGEPDDSAEDPGEQGDPAEPAEDPGEQGDPAEPAEDPGEQDNFADPAADPEEQGETDEAAESEEPASVEETESEDNDTAEPEETENSPIADTAAKYMLPVLRAPEDFPEDGITVYFAVPNDWSSSDYDEVWFNIKKGTGENDPWSTITMTNTGRTYNERPVYSVHLTAVQNDTTTSDNCPWGGLATIQFQARLQGVWKKQIVAINNSWTWSSTFNGKLYANSYNNGGWSEYVPDPIHQTYAERLMAFDNQSGSDLSDVKAIFFEPDDNGDLEMVDTIELGAVADGAFKTFSVPAKSCSYVQFVNGDDVLGDTYSRFYDEGEDEAGVEKFEFDQNTKFSYCYKGTSEDSTWGIPSPKTIYFDATLSKLEIIRNDAKDENRNSQDYSIPNAQNHTVYYCYPGVTSGYLYGAMTPVEGYTDIYSVEVPGTVEQIVFSSYLLEAFTNDPNGGKYTNTLSIPDDLEKPCFYADSSDDSIYENGYRGGYWDELGKLRNAEKGKNTDVVNIQSGTFEYDDRVFYVNSTFYDYYTDYELNGNNRDGYVTSVNGRGAHRTYVTFRHFDQALSDAYREQGVSIPLYTGHFQKQDWGSPFRDIADTLNLYGYDKDNEAGFMSTNNSDLDATGESGKYASAAQGLVYSSLSGGNVRTSEGEMVLPHFDEDFLTGNNTKNTVLGEVYHNVRFPFTKVDLNDNGVYYWSFDSSETTLAMRHDSNSGYFLEDVGNQPWSQNVNSRGNLDVDPVSTTYGFFPFNEGSTGVAGSTYNYGFGAKLEFKFHLTEDGTVMDQDGNPVPIEFNFAGDDDVWVFVDGHLALDIGGAHGTVAGTINFSGKDAAKTGTVSSVKASQGYTPNGGATPSGISARRAPSAGVTSTFTISGSNTDEHTLTMFYMERGMWESNMKVNFNFPDENVLSVEKKVDTETVNDLFDSLFHDDLEFTFHLRNLATHFGEKAVTSGNENFIPGFRVKQEDIPDYGTSVTGKLANAAGAVYTSSLGEKGESKTVDDEGNFTLVDGETADFFNQFRRGSYIALQEVLKGQEENLYTPTWTVLDTDGKPVTAMAAGATITKGSKTDLTDQKGTAVDDDRTENRVAHEAGINAYQDSETATRPDGTFVFRSYSDPDNSSLLTKVSVTFTNKVNTGSLTIRKDKAYEDDELNETYQFVVAFSNVGGLALEEETIYTDIISLKVGESETITGIPVGTEYTIYELKTVKDHSGLDSVVSDDNSVAFTDGTVNGINAYAVSGTIANEDGSEVTYTFKNTPRPVITVVATKVWDDEDDADGLRSDVTFYLQRSDDGDTFTTVDTKTISALAGGDDLTVSWEDLPERENGKDYTYRVTEAELDGYEASITSNREDHVLTFVITNTHVVTPQDEPTPDEPTPDEPTPDEPTPDEPTPEEPIPDEPTPDEPTPDEPGSNEPAPQREYTRRTTKGAANTGDDSNLVLWSVLGATSLAACGGALVFRRKKKNDHNGTHHR